MRIEKITRNKKKYLDLLLLADEQEDMIDRYLESGDMFALYNDDLKTVCVVVAIDREICELKNIATYKKYQGKGYARALIKFVSDYYKNNYNIMLVGTGDTPTILSFYKSCGFEKSHFIKNFFTDNYNHPMIEDGIQLIDGLSEEEIINTCCLKSNELFRWVLKNLTITDIYCKLLGVSF